MNNDPFITGFKVVVLILILTAIPLIFTYDVKPTQQLNAEQLPAKESRLQMIEQTSLGSRNNIYLISVSGKEFIVVSNWVGGIQIMKVD